MWPLRGKGPEIRETVRGPHAVVGWVKYAKPAAHVWDAGYLDRALVTADDAGHGRHSKPAAGEFGRKEWLEDSCQNRRLHACALVGYLDEHVEPRQGFGALHTAGQLGRIELLSSGRQPDGSGTAFQRSAALVTRFMIAC